MSIETLGKLIKKYRNNKGYSPQLLADNLDISTGLLNNIENARTDSFNLKLLNIIIKELNIPTPTSIVNNDYIEIKIPIDYKALNVASSYKFNVFVN